MIKRITLFFLAMTMGTSLVLQPVAAIVAMAVVVIFFLFFYFPHIVVPLLLISRSGLDMFTEVGIKIGPMLLNVPSITSIFLLFGGCGFFASRFAVKHGVRLDRVGKAFLCWIIVLSYWVIESYINFGVPGLIACREWIRLASLFIIYLLTFLLVKEVGYEKIVAYLFYALPIPIIVGLYQIMTGSGMASGRISRINSVFVHPNSLALFLVLFIGLTLWKIIFGRNRIVWLILISIECLLLISTFSINGFTMFLVMLAVFGLKAIKTRHRQLVIIIFIAVVIAFFSSDYGRERVEEITKTGSYREIIRTGRIYGGGSLAWRILNWNLFVREWRSSPLFGFGLHTAGQLISPLNNEVHNDFLRMLVDTGAIGLIFYLLFLGIVGVELWRLYERSVDEDPQFSCLALIMFAVYVSWVAGSIADNYITVTVFQYYFWSIVGALTARYNNAIDQ